MVLVATVKDAAANSFLTVARADVILGQRLYSTDWDSAGTTPDAAGYLVDGGASIGSTTIAVDTGSGTFTAGSKVKFADHATLYEVSTALAAPGNLVLTSGLTDAVSDGEAISRQTAYEKEKALIWATRLLDDMMIWHGSKRTTTQALRWPRSGVLKADGDWYGFDAIPEILERATSELALHLLGTDRFKLPGMLGQGISKAKIGPLEVVADSGQREALVPQNILSILSPLGRLEPEAQVGTRILPIART